MIQLMKYGKVVTVCTKRMYALLRISENMMAVSIGRGENASKRKERARVLRVTRMIALRSFYSRTKLSKPTNFWQAKFSP